MNDNEVERGPYVLPHPHVLANMFTEREGRLIDNCQLYAANDPAGLPGHNLMVVIAKLCELYSISGKDILHANWAQEPPFVEDAQQ